MNKKVTKDNLTDLIDEINPSQAKKPAQKPSGSVSAPKTPKIVSPEIPPELSDYEVLLPDGTVVTLGRINKSTVPLNMEKEKKPARSHIKVIKDANGNEYIQIVVEEETEYKSPKMKVIKK